MKNHRQWLNCALGIGLLALTALFGIRLLWLPFHWIGAGLRWLSLSGTAGNLCALALYLLLGLLPMLLAIGRTWKPESWLLPCACCVLLYVLYYSVNPGLRPALLRGEAGDLILAGSFWSLLLCWVLIRFLNGMHLLDTSRILRLLRFILKVCAGLLVLIGIGLGLYQLIGQLQALRQQNTLPGLNLLPTQLMLFLSYGATATEYLLDAAVMVLTASLLGQLEADPYSEASCRCADMLVRRCRQALTIILLTHTAMNLAKLLLAGHLLVVNTAFTIPVVSIAINLAALALSRLLVKGRQLKEDNDLFI